MNVDNTETLATSVTIVNLPVREELALFRSSALVPDQKKTKNKQTNRRGKICSFPAFQNHGFFCGYNGKEEIATSTLSFATSFHAEEQKEGSCQSLRIKLFFFLPSVYDEVVKAYRSK